MINFPNSPLLGQTYTANGVTYMWDGVKWYKTTYDRSLDSQDIFKVKYTELLNKNDLVYSYPGLGPVDLSTLTAVDSSAGESSYRELQISKDGSIAISDHTSHFRVYKLDENGEIINSRLIYGYDLKAGGYDILVGHISDNGEKNIRRR